jgi:hypothetical protein
VDSTHVCINNMLEVPPEIAVSNPLQVSWQLWCCQHYMMGEAARRWSGLYVLLFVQGFRG